MWAADKNALNKVRNTVIVILMKVNGLEKKKINFSYGFTEDKS